MSKITTKDCVAAIRKRFGADDAAWKRRSKKKEGNYWVRIFEFENQFIKVRSTDDEVISIEELSPRDFEKKDEKFVFNVMHEEDADLDVYEAQVSITPKSYYDKHGVFDDRGLESNIVDDIIAKFNKDIDQGSESVWWITDHEFGHAGKKTLAERKAYVEEFRQHLLKHGFIEVSLYGDNVEDD